jgi:hypothetical protein
MKRDDFLSANNEKPTNVRNHKRLCMLLNDLYEQKNAAYGNSFSKTYEEYGPTMLCIRLDDKLSRAKQLLLKGAEENDETAVDTLLDLANYAIMGVMELREKKGKEDKFSVDKIGC